jgi:O-antigen/teichoic acid export membrane protein
MPSTVKPALVLMSGRAIAFVASFLLPVALVRIFDPATFGTYKQLFLVYTTLYVIGSVTAESLFYFLPRQPRQAGRYVANAALALVAVGAAFLALVWSAAAPIARALGNPALERLLPLLGAFLMLMLPAVTLEIVMISRNRYRAGSWAYAASDVLRVAALLLPAALTRRLEWLLAGGLAFAVMRLLGALAYFRREFAGALRPQARPAAEQLAYALPFALMVVVETLQGNFHHYAVSHHFDAATFAVYSVGCFQIPLLELVASPMGNVMMVRMAEAIRDGRPHDPARILSGTARALALLFFPLLALLLVAAPDLIVFLFTDAYRASVPIFLIWSMTIALAVVPAEAALRVYAATRFLLAVSALRLALLAGLMSWAIGWLGLRGAVLLTVGLAVPARLAALARVARLMNVPLSRALPWRHLGGLALVSTAAAAPALVARAAVAGPLFARMAVTGAVLAGVYLLLLYHSGLLSGDEKQAVRDRLWRFWPAAPAEDAGRP